MAQAKYSIMIPKVDNLGNPLTDIANAAHTALFYQGIAEGSTVQENQRGQWRDETPEPHETLIVITEDNPHNDSLIKHVATQVGEVANQWGIFVYKEGKSGIQSWVMNNAHYRPGEPAEDLALQQSTDPTAAPSLL